MKVTLTPMDINNKEFKRGMRGYNPDEVDDFLDEIVDNYESIYKENSSLKERVASLTEQLEQYKSVENSIQKAIILAQETADKAKASSEKEAEMVVKTANETAQKILDKAHSDVVQINNEYEDLKQEFIKFRARFRSFMTTQLETFEELEKDFTKSFSIINVEEEAEELKEINNEVQLTEDITIEEEAIKNIEENSAVDEIDQIKSFFAKKDNEHKI